VSPAPQLAYLTTREAAARLGVSVRTVQLWVENGILEAWKTSGGHRRVSYESVERQLLKQAPSPSAPQDEGLVAKPRLRVVVVEDDPLFLRLYQGMIERWGMPIDVLLAEDGYYGLLLIGQQTPDMIITDLQMPGMDGFRLLRAVLADPLLKDTEVVAISSLSPDVWAQYGGLPPGVTFFSKPPPFDLLRQRLEDLARRRGINFKAQGA